MKNKKGFTLVELLCIIVILGVCITASIVAVTRVINTANKVNNFKKEYKEGFLKCLEEFNYYLPILLKNLPKGTVPFGKF